MDSKLIDEILLRDEGQFLEYKSAYLRGIPSPHNRRKVEEIAEDVVETLNAFTNADGGTLLIGIEDDKRVTGVDYGEKQLTKILNSPRNRFATPQSYRVERLDYLGKTVLKFEIDPSPIPIQLTDGKYLYRVGEHDLPFPADKIEALKLAKAKTVYERQIEPRASVNDLDAELLGEFGRRVGIGDRVEEALHVLQGRYRLIDFHNSVLRLTKMALLLFANDPLKWHPRCYVDFVKYEGKERKYGEELNVIKREQIEAPLVSLIDATYAIIKQHIKERVILHDLLFTERFEYPTFAWQEAIVNAIAHRDYAIEGSAIEVSMFDDRIEVRSPGRLPEPVELSELGKRRAHFSRNPLLVRVLADLGYMADLGEGIPRMFREMENHFLVPPEFHEEGFYFNVTLRNTPILDESSISWLQRFDSFALNQRQKRVLAYSRQHSNIFSAKDYRSVTDVNHQTATQDIIDMRRKGVIRRQRGRYLYQIIEPAGPMLSQDEIRKSILSLILQEGIITNREVRRMFGMSRYEALKILTSMVDEGFLKLEGRGRGARYIATKRFLANR